MSQNAKMWAFGFFMLAVGAVSGYAGGHVAGMKDMYAKAQPIRDMLGQCFRRHSQMVQRELEREAQQRDQALLQLLLGL